MLKMSFYDGTLDREKAKEYVLASDKPVKHTCGFVSSNVVPTTYKKPITKEEAIKMIEDEGFLDIAEREDYIHFNTYTANDMY